jgi:hypothetical protein
MACEDRPDQRIALRPLVKAPHQPIDHRLVDAGARDDLGDEEIAAGFAVLGCRAH